MAELQLQQQTKTPSYRVRGELTIYSATENGVELLAAVQHHPLLEVNLEEVTELDISGVQILLMLKKAALASQHHVHFVNHSAAVGAVLELLNLVAELGDPLLILGEHS